MVVLNLRKGGENLHATTLPVKRHESDRTYRAKASPGVPGKPDLVPRRLSSPPAGFSAPSSRSKAAAGQSPGSEITALPRARYQPPGPSWKSPGTPGEAIPGRECMSRFLALARGFKFRNEYPPHLVT